MPCKHHTEIGTDMKKRNRPNDVILIPHRSYVSLNGYIWSFPAPENARAHSVILIFPIFNVFHKRQSTRNTFLPNLTTTLPCTRSLSTQPIFVPTVQHGQLCTWKCLLFPIVDRFVCTIQMNQTSDALIKYVT